MRIAQTATGTRRGALADGHLRIGGWWPDADIPSGRFFFSATFSWGITGSEGESHQCGIRSLFCPLDN